MLNGEIEGLAGEPMKVDLQAKNSLNAIKSVGGDTFTVDYAGPETSKPQDLKIVDNNNGTYSVHFKLSKSGLHILSIKSNGIHLSNSPVAVTVNAASKSLAKNCVVGGDGLTHGVLAESSEFYIITRDAFGNIRRTGGDNVIIELKVCKSSNKL